MENSFSAENLHLEGGGMQLQSRLERRQFRFLIGLPKIGCLLLKAAGDLLNLRPEGVYGDHELYDGGGVRIRRSQDLLKLLLDLRRLLHNRL